MNEQKTNKNCRQKIVLAALYLFSQNKNKKADSPHGRDKEVSWPEIAECVKEFQKKFPLGYEFSDELLVCQDLIEDLKDLWLDKNYIRMWTNEPRGVPLFPTNFVALKPEGANYIKREVLLSFEMIEALNKAIELAIERYKKTWGPYSR